MQFLRVNEGRYDETAQSCNDTSFGVPKYIPAA